MSAWEVEYTDEFGDWWDELSNQEQADASAIVDLLVEVGTALGYPHSSGIIKRKEGLIP